MKNFQLLILFLLSTLLMLVLPTFIPQAVKEDAWLYLTLICELGTICFTIICIIDNHKQLKS